MADDCYKLDGWCQGLFVLQNDQFHTYMCDNKIYTAMEFQILDPALSKA